MERGFFITFEGGEGCGKSTHSKKAFEYLKNKGVETIHTKEPRGEIRELVMHSKIEIPPKSEFLLYSADRLDHMLSIVIPNIMKGASVVSDRHADSSRAYQGYGRGVDLDYIEKVTRIVTQDISPDITFLFDMDSEKALERAKRVTGGKYDRFESEKIDFHNKLRKGFLQIAKNNPNRVKIIDADGSIDGVFSKIVPYLDKVADCVATTNQNK